MHLHGHTAPPSLLFEWEGYVVKAAHKKAIILKIKHIAMTSYQSSEILSLNLMNNFAVFCHK